MRHGRYHDKTIFIRSAENDNGVLSNRALTVYWLLGIQHHSSDKAHTVPLGRGWKFFGFVSITTPKWMFDWDMIVVCIGLRSIHLICWVFMSVTAPKLLLLRALGYQRTQAFQEWLN